MDAVVIDLVELPSEADNDLQRSLALRKITFAPSGEPNENSHLHPGSFVLWVESGAICYTRSSSDSSESMVVAFASNDGAAPLLCGESRTDCSSDDGCSLLPGESVYLPTGSTIKQFGPAEHTYKNASAVDPAVVYLTDLQTYDPSEPGTLGCGGKCW